MKLRELVTLASLGLFSMGLSSCAKRIDSTPDFVPSRTTTYDDLPPQLRTFTTEIYDGPISLGHLKFTSLHNYSDGLENPIRRGAIMSLTVDDTLYTITDADYSESWGGNGRDSATKEFSDDAGIIDHSSYGCVGYCTRERGEELIYDYRQDGSNPTDLAMFNVCMEMATERFNKLYKGAYKEMLDSLLVKMTH